MRSNRPCQKGGFVDDLEADGRRPYGGDDSNLSNIIEREIQDLRDEKGGIVKDLLSDDQQGGITDSARSAAMARIKELNEQIKTIKTVQARQKVPVYFATRLDSLRANNPEDNPLAYAGDLPGTAHVAVYDRRALVAAGIPLWNKSPAQIRIATFGSELMRHCLAVLRINVTD